MASASSKKFLDIQASYRLWIHSETCTWDDNNIMFNQNAWLKPYIVVNTDLRKKANNDFEKDAVDDD